MWAQVGRSNGNFASAKVRFASFRMRRACQGALLRCEGQSPSCHACSFKPLVQPAYENASLHLNLERFVEDWLEREISIILCSSSEAMNVHPCKRLRIRGKTTPPEASQTPLVGELPDYTKEENEKARKRVYLVTLPHPRQDASGDGRRLVAPETFSAEQILEIFQHCAFKPEYTDAHNIVLGSQVHLEQLAIFREFHKPTQDGTAHAHFHIAVRAQPFKFLPMKRALMKRHGLASHWSCTHDGYWSALRYGVLPSPSKPCSALDPKPLLWCRDGPHPDVFESIHEPLTAQATQNRRRALEMKAAEEGKMAPKITDLDIYAVVDQKGFRNSADYPHAHLDLIHHVKLHSSTAVQAYVWKHRARLSALIDDVWQWETVECSLTLAKEARLVTLQRAAAEPCACNGVWIGAVVQSFLMNGVDVKDLCTDVLTALTDGRSETTPVIVLAGALGGEGKSLFFKAFLALFGSDHVFQMPEKSNFPLLNLELGPKVAFLDEWRFVNKAVSFGTQCVWFDGSAVPVARPQNVPGKAGHFLYRGSAPIFVTGKLEDIEALAAHVDGPRDRASVQR